MQSGDCVPSSSHPSIQPISAGQEKESLPRQKSNVQAEQFEGFNTFTGASCCAVCVTLGLVPSGGHWNARQRCSNCRCTCAEGGFGQFFLHKGYYKVPKSSLCLNFTYTKIHEGKLWCIKWSLSIKAIIPTFPSSPTMESYGPGLGTPVIQRCATFVCLA